MTVSEFDNGYWYATELKEFAKAIAIPGATKLRKDELERAITHFLRTGKVRSPTKRSLSTRGMRDVDRGLSLALRVVVYTNDKATKEFLEREARKLSPGMKRKSGARYRLNRWRENQLTSGVALTYGALVKQYVKLNETEGSFAQIPHGRYINFMSDFLRRGEGRYARRRRDGVEEAQDPGCSEELSVMGEGKIDRAHLTLSVPTHGPSAAYGRHSGSPITMSRHFSSCDAM